MQQHGIKYFGYRHAPTMGIGSIGQNTTFSEHGHAAYQIKGKHECTNGNKYFAHRSPYPHPGDEFNRSKFNFSEHGHVAYQTESRNIATW